MTVEIGEGLLDGIGLPGLAASARLESRRFDEPSPALGARVSLALLVIDLFNDDRG